MDENETVINFGDAVKAIKTEDGNVQISGYLVRFSDEETPDLTGEYFTKNTDFGEIGKADVYFNHCIPIDYEGKKVGYTKKVTRATLDMDEVGILADAILYARNEYEKMLQGMALAGKLGWSSGTASHLVERENTGKAVQIKRWTLGADASITPTPAEPRNTVITLKSYLGEQPTEGDPEAVKAESEVGDNSTIGDVKMEKEELQALMDEVSETAALKAVEMYKESEPATKSATLIVTKDEADQPFETEGEFFMAVKAASFYPSGMDKRLLPYKALGLNEAIPSQGGFLVPEATSARLLEKVYGTGTLLSQFSRDAVSGNNMNYNVVDETSRANGSRFGGVTGYWLAEAATKTASKPAFRQLELKLKKVAAVVAATDELLEDANALESWIMRTVPNELRFMVENAIINGDGAGKPLGILPSPALISATRADVSQIDAVDIGNMWARRYAGVNDYIWLGNQGIFPQMLNLAIGNVPVFLPSGGLSGLPYTTLLGRPYFDTEYNPSIGKAGDLLLVSPSQYQMIEKASGIQAASSIHVAFLSDQSYFRFVMRIDGAPVWDTTLTGYDGITYSPYVCLTSAST